jgi:hypothetical protein
MTTPTIKETKCPKCGADSEELPLEWNSKEWRCASHVRKGDGFYQSSECIERERDDLLKERAAALENTRPSSPIADRLADALKALLEEANAYASLMPASEEGSPSGEAEAILAEYDAQRSSADGWVSVEERLPDVVCLSCWTAWVWSEVPKQPVTALGQCPECGTAGNFRNIKLPQPPKGATT